jgi:HPt (histidine-containing phosphotransfer) domain-containing protein
MMDITEVASRLGLDEEDIYSVLELFIQTAPDDLTALSSAWERQDLTQVGKSAHSLKGSTGTLGFMEISNMAQRIMQQSRENQLDELTQTVPAFATLLNDLIAELEAVVKNK